MRRCTVLLAGLTALLLSACDFWPRDLQSLADYIAREASGEATAWLLGGDTVVIDVVRSPLFNEAQPALEIAATGFAARALEHVPHSLESVVVTFHEHDLSADPERLREFVFFVSEGRPVLQPALDLDASGPLTPTEIERMVGGLDQALPPGKRDCVQDRLARRAAAAGDPEHLDPATVEYLSPDTWTLLDAFGRRLILAQAVTTAALFDCAGESATEPRG